MRIIPRDDIQAQALLAVMTQTDGCQRVAMINDNSPYGEALANNLRDQNDGRVRVEFSQSVGPDGHYEHLVEQVGAMRLKPDCFLYSGTKHPNTVEIFEAFAEALKTAKLYGTDGLASASFFDSRNEGALARAVAGRVTLMVAPYEDNNRYQQFVADFEAAYGSRPGPKAVYAYEAMRVAGACQAG